MALRPFWAVALAVMSLAVVPWAAARQTSARPLAARGESVSSADTVVSLTSVSCTRAQACWAVGFVNRGQVELSFAARLRNRSWSLVTVPNPSRVTQLSSVSCWSASGCEAVGEYFTAGNSGRTLAERWDGRRWTVQATGQPASGDQVRELTAVACLSATHCEAVGDNDGGTLVEGWDGRRWSVQPSPSPSSSTALVSVSCASANVCVAVGSAVSASRTRSRPLVEAWNGRRWSVQAAPVPPGADNTNPLSVDCPTARFCSLVGKFNRSTEIGVPGIIELPLTERFNGSRWRLERTTPPRGQAQTELTSVACPAAGRCRALGTVGIGLAAVSVIGTYRRDHWTLETDDSPLSANNTESRQLSCPTVSVCVAVDGLSAVHFTGTRWTSQAVPPPVVDLSQ